MIDRKLLKTNRWEDEEYLHARMTNACFNGGGGGNGGDEWSGDMDDWDDMGEVSDQEVADAMGQIERDDTAREIEAQMAAQDAVRQAQAQENARIAAESQRQEAQAQAAAAAAQARQQQAAQQAANQNEQELVRQAQAQAAQNELQARKDIAADDYMYEAGGLLDPLFSSDFAATGTAPVYSGAPLLAPIVNQETRFDRWGNAIDKFFGMPQDVISQIDTFKEIIASGPYKGGVEHGDGSITDASGKQVRGPTRDWNPPWYMDPNRDRGDRREDRDDSWITDQTTTTTPTTTTPPDWIIDGPGGPSGSYGPYGPYGPSGSYGPYGPYGPSGPYGPGPYGSYGPGAPFTWPTQQDWTRFMPQNFPLAEQGGLHYQPWLAGGGGMGGGAGGFAGPDLPPGYTTGGGLIAGGPGPINTNIWGDTATAVPPITTGAGPGGFEGDTYNSEGVMVDRQGNPVDRPAWGIQFPSGGQGFKVVPSATLPYYQTEEGALDPWAPAQEEAEHDFGQQGISEALGGGWTVG